MKLFLVLNPTAQSGRGKTLWSTMFNRLRESGTEFNYRITEKQFEAIALARQAVHVGYDTVVAVGGDGTICEVITGIMQAREQITTASDTTGKPSPRFGVIYTGTSPDFNTYHGIPLDPAEAVDAVINGTPRSIDVGKVIYCISDLSASVPDLENRTVADLVHDDVVTEYFVGNVNVGIGPMVARKANTGYRRLIGDLLGTMSAVISSFATFPMKDLRLVVDGNEFVREKLVNLTVGKSPYLASGMKIFSDITPDDGRLVVLSVCNFTLMSLVARLPALYRGSFLDLDGVDVTYGKTVDIHYDRGHPEVEFDGDPKGFLPARVEVIPAGLEVMFPHDG